MGTVEEYSDYPLTTTRTIAWDSPSTWGHAFSTESTFQPLTKSNLSAHDKVQPSCFDPKSEIMAKYYSSMKNNYNVDALRSSPKATDNNTNHHKKHRRQMTTTSATTATTTTTTTKSVAIDVYPLPFPYHNDNTFLPTVETGRTRFDSESTQSLYDHQPPSPTHILLHQRHLYSRHLLSNDTPSRINGSYHRHRCDSRTSHYSAFTIITDTTASTTSNITNTNSALHSQQSGRQSRFQTTKRQLSTLISRNRFNTIGTQHRLSTLFTTKRTCYSSLGGGGGTTSMTGRRSDLSKAKGTQHEYGWRPSSAMISPAAYYDYCQGKPIAVSPPSSSPSPSPQHYQQSRHLYPSISEKTPCGTTAAAAVNVFVSISPHTACATGTSSPHLHHPSFWKNQMVYTLSPSKQYNQKHNNNNNNNSTSSYPPPPQKIPFLSRFARKVWPFKQN